MLEGLQKKWKVGGLQLVLVLCTFAIGGSLTGYVGRRLMNLFGIDSSWLWVLLYITVIAVLWPAAVLLVSIPFGQFRFFTHYLRRIWRRMSGDQKIKMKNEKSGSGHNVMTNPNGIIRVAIFASGAGSNAQKIIDRFRNSSRIHIALIVCNKPGAGVLTIAERENISSLLLDKEQFFRGNAYVDELHQAGVNFIVLAGFLWKVPLPLIRAYTGRIVNIHPALLPSYGGKGMYGRHVHEAVIAAGDTESGISIHYVDEQYDHGALILQARCPVLVTDTPDSLAARIHLLEHEHYPAVVERLLTTME